MDGKLFFGLLASLSTFNVNKYPKKTPDFLIVKGRNLELGTVLAKFSPNFTFTKNDKFEERMNIESGSSVGQLFKNKRGLSTSEAA
ncbi:hypothetical protein ACFFH4_10435 [Halalkalibacter alkalisediminis]|uniref:Uncharacterized protein n=1 Tax=Halalkalibacter alkalisediminis TaxID=935616 RepID=A0ABV6NFG4_9BACI